jgi:hypothetical protein
MGITKSGLVGKKVTGNTKERKKKRRRKKRVAKREV